ncbi:MAG: DUF2157 domain-containing protein [Acutalibacteraceae bacterium]|nr:DUF2157 domain-containing protein [Acutalibacteraceae bacterium]
MTKISKNIKRLRMLQNMSQEELAQKLFVSRQAVSSWENNRTQPDLDMIQKIAELFGVEVEELLYGEKRNTKLEESVRTSKTLFMVFSILGSLFVGAGVIILMVALWDKFPNIMKATVSFLPLLLGQAGAVYTYKKKFDNIAWREGASILWSAGVTATVGLLSMVLELHLGALMCLLIDAVLILPILCFFKVVSPLVFYYGFSIAGSIGVLEYTRNEILTTIIMVALVGVGLLFTFFNRKNVPDARYEYSSWISVIAACAMVLVVSIGILEWGYFSLPLALAVCIYALNKHDGWSMPFYPIGILGTAVGSIFSTYFNLMGETYYSYKENAGWLNLIKSESIITIILTVATLAIGFIIGEKALDKNKYQSIFCYLGGAAAVIGLFNPVFKSVEWIGLILFAITFVEGLVMLIKGASEKNYFNLNVGLIMLLVLMFFVLSEFDWNMVTVGLMFLISGTSLFGANFCISKKIKKEQLELDKAVEDYEK